MMKKHILISLSGILLLGGAVFFTACGRGSEKGTNTAGSSHAAKYHCPMHPTYVSERAGDCPICGMRLVPIESEENHAASIPGNPTGVQEKRLLYYRNPMDPRITSPVPMQDGMGMDYVPVYEEDAAEMRESTVPGLAPIRFPAEREQLIGVKTSAVVRREISKVIRASGRIAYDPDLYSAVVEYREALKSKVNVQKSPWAEVRERTDGLISASVLRLRQMGLSDSQIDRLGRAKRDPTNLLLATEGGSVWVYADVFEYESGLVKNGQEMEITSVAFPGRTFHGKIVAVDTILNRETRTLRARGEVPSAGLLKPEMYVDVKIPISLGQRLTVPEEAVMRTGTRNIVFVKTAPGRFEPREVVVGQEGEDAVEVLSGIEEGEAVVTSANFLIDSESKIKSALSLSSGPSH
jgi:Cu(I)/Ag(I) efflux system membrane fusion protein